MSTQSTHMTQTSSPAPIPVKTRAVSLDVLRGIAVLGILPLLIQSYAEPWTASLSPAANGHLIGQNGIIWIITHILFSQKFLAILSALFGAGIVLMASRSGAHSAARHIRRMAGLLAIGLALTVFSPTGGVLALFAVCGLIVFPCKKWPGNRLIIAGTLSLALGALCVLTAGAAFTALSPEEVNDTFNVFYWLSLNAPFNLFFLMSFMWRTLGLMLAGMALLKWGALHAACPASRYVMIITIAVFIGYPLIIFGILKNVSHGWDMAYAIGVGAQFNYWGSLIVAGGYAGFTMLICKYGAWRRMRAGLSAIGRTALSNFFIQIMFCIVIFPGYGLSPSGQIDRLDQLAIAGMIALVQMIISPFWLRYFRIGPVEWVWRWGTYAKRPRFIYMNRVFAPYIQPK